MVGPCRSLWTFISMKKLAGLGPQKFGVDVLEEPRDGDGRVRARCTALRGRSNMQTKRHMPLTDHAGGLVAASDALTAADGAPPPPPGPRFPSHELVLLDLRRLPLCDRHHEVDVPARGRGWPWSPSGRVESPRCSASNLLGCLRASTEGIRRRLPLPHVLVHLGVPRTRRARRKRFFASSTLARIDWQKWRPFPALLLGGVVRMARPDHVEMDEADVGDGAVERGVVGAARHGARWRTPPVWS